MGSDAPDVKLGNLQCRGKTMGKPMGKPWESHGKPMEKPWESHGKARNLRILNMFGFEWISMFFLMDDNMIKTGYNMDIFGENNSQGYLQ
jgi:hypothetical protein